MWSVCYYYIYSPEPSMRMVVFASALFVFVESNGGSAKEAVMTCCRPLFFVFFLIFLFVCSLISLPTGLMAASSSSSTCCFVRETALISFELFCPCDISYLLRVLSVQQVSVPLQHVCCYSCTLKASLSDLLASHCSKHLSFVLFCFVFFFSFLPFLWSGLFCCVLVTWYARISLALP